MVVRKVAAVNVETVKRYAKMAEYASGTAFYSDLALQMEYKAENGRWTFYGATVPTIIEAGETFYIKRVGDIYVLYKMRSGRDIERYYIQSESTLKFFGLMP